MALPAILAKLVDTVAVKVAETAATQVQIVDKLTSGGQVSFKDIQEAAEHLDGDNASGRIARVASAPSEADL